MTFSNLVEGVWSLKFKFRLWIQHFDVKRYFLVEWRIKNEKIESKMYRREKRKRREEKEKENEKSGKKEKSKKICVESIRYDVLVWKKIPIKTKPQTCAVSIILCIASLNSLHWFAAKKKN